jgi:hypothetical protein
LTERRRRLEDMLSAMLAGDLEVATRHVSLEPCR